MTDQTQLREACERLRRSMRVTTGARFNASKRLHKHDEHLNVAVAFVTVYLITLTIFQATFTVEHAVDRTITFTNIVFSIMVLVFALLQYASSDAIHAEQHHKCALEIDELRRQLDVMMLCPNARELERISDRYSEVLKSSNLNHDEPDMLLYVCDRPELGFDIKWIRRFKIKAMAAVRSFTPYLIVILAGLGTCGLVFYASHHIKNLDDKQAMKPVTPTDELK